MWAWKGPRYTGLGTKGVPASNRYAVGHSQSLGNRGPLFRRCSWSQRPGTRQGHSQPVWPVVSHAEVREEKNEQRTLELPNGMTCTYSSKLDVEFLYHEVYEKRGYLKHGVTLSPGNTVMDVGANIGFFAMSAAEMCGSAGTVICMEPIPETHEALLTNMKLHRRWHCDSGDSVPANVTALNCGVGDGTQPFAEFTSYPRAAGWSTMRPDPDGVVRDMTAFLDSSLATPNIGIPETLLVRMARGVQRLFPWLVRLAVRLYVWAVMLRVKEVLRCQLKSVSQVMLEQRLSTVDLLKIDVERAEVDALRGVEPSDWPQIQQVVMEVHDSNNALQEAMSILTGAGGFDNVVVEQDDALKGTDLYTMYCTRADSAVAGP